MQEYQPPAGTILYKDGIITQSEFQNINNTPVTLVSNPTGKFLPIFFYLLLRLELTNLTNVPITLKVTSSYNLNNYASQYASLDIFNTNVNLMYVIQPSQNFPTIDQAFFLTDGTLTSDNNLILEGNTDDNTRTISGVINYRVYYSIYSL